MRARDGRCPPIAAEPGHLTGAGSGLCQGEGSAAHVGGFDAEHITTRTIVDDERTHHTHGYPSDDFDDWILFRDLLRRDAGARRAYAEAKRVLVGRLNGDRGSYVEAREPARPEATATTARVARRSEARPRIRVPERTGAAVNRAQWCRTGRMATYVPSDPRRMDVRP